MFEASMNFDLENVQPFLTRLEARLGLGLAVADLVAATESTPVDSEITRTMSVVFNGSPARLDYRVFMDDVDAPDLYFLTDSQELRDAIDRQLRQFADDLGI